GTYDIWQSTTQIVRVRIRNRRIRYATKQTPPEVGLGRQTQPGEPDPVGKELTLDDHLRIALNDHPYFRESTARALFRENLRLGAAGLQVVGAPFDQAIMLASGRYAARSWRGPIR